MASQSQGASPSARAERERLLELCQDAVDRALAAGADEAEACAQASAGASIHLEKGDLQLAKSHEGEALGLRVFCGGRLGFASTNQARARGALNRLAEDAVALARFAPVDPAAGLMVTQPVTAIGLLEAPPAWDLEVEHLLAHASSLLDAVRSFDRRVSLDQGSLSHGRSSQAVVSSRGARAAESDAGLSASLFGMAVDGDDVGGFDSKSIWLRRVEGFPERAVELAKRFEATTLGNLKAGRASSYRGQVLLSPDAFWDLVVGPLLGALSALSVQRGRSILAGRLGDKIAPLEFHLVDDPRDEELAGATAADREGVGAQPLDLVRGGELKTYLHNGRSARVEQLPISNGRAQGGPRSVPGLGAHAPVVGAGSGGAQGEMLARLGTGVWVGRFSGTVDPTSGDFSGVAKSARWVERGEVVRSLGETLVAGNALECLGKISALSTERDILGASARLPWALVDGVTVTGG